MSLALLVSLFVTPDLAASLPKLAGMILGLGVYFAVLHHARRKDGWRRSLAAFLLLGSGVALLGLVGTRWVTDKFQALIPLAAKLPSLLLRLPGAANGLQPNEVAGALLWVLPLMACLAAIAFRRGKAGKALARSRAVATVLLLAALLAGGVLVLTQSRGAWLALAVTAALLLLLLLPPRARLALLGVYVLVAAGAGYGVASGRVGNLLSGGTADALAADPGFSLSDVQLRLDIWQGAIMGLQDFPLTGMGMNVFRQELDRLYPWYGMNRSRDYAHAHNEFLQAGLDLGLPGMVAFTSLYGVAFWMLAVLWRRLKLANSYQLSAISIPLVGTSYPHLEKAVLLGLGGGLLAHLLYGLTDAVALGAKPGILFWMLLGLIAGLYESVDR
jgi:putative inorganic carbon (HCO3(-)) transporter